MESPELAPIDPNDQAFLDYLGKHLGVLAVEYVDLDANANPKGPRQILSYSGFFAVLDGQWYFVTAGHVFDRDDEKDGKRLVGLVQALRASAIGITSAMICDFFGPDAKLEGGPTIIDFPDVLKDTIYVNDEILGLDFAFMPLRDWYVTSVKGNGVEPLEIAKKYYKGKAQKYVVIGFPDEEKRPSNDPRNAQDGSVRLCFLRMDKCRLPRNLRKPKLPYFAAKLPDEGPNSAEGFSGSPVFAVDVDLKKNRTYYTLIGIDYSWFDDEKIVMGCLLKGVVAQVRKRLKKSKAKAKARNKTKGKRK